MASSTASLDCGKDDDRVTRVPDDASKSTAVVAAALWMRSQGTLCLH